MVKARFVVSIGLALSLGSVHAAGTQGLGDAAKKEKARRSADQAKDPAKVYTNEGILPTGEDQPSRGTFNAVETPPTTSTAAPTTTAMPRSRAAATAPPTQSEAAGAPEASASPSADKGESYWRSRVQQAQSAITAADRKVKELEAQAAREQRMGDARPIDCTTERRPGEAFTAWRDRALAQSKKCEQAAASTPAAASTLLEAARRDAAAARKALDDLYEEARRAGALPGWLR
jgi:hypothetical protein